MVTVQKGFRKLCGVQIPKSKCVQAVYRIGACGIPALLLIFVLLITPTVNDFPLVNFDPPPSPSAAHTPASLCALQVCAWYTPLARPNSVPGPTFLPGVVEVVTHGRSLPCFTHLFNNTHGNTNGSPRENAANVNRIHPSSRFSSLWVFCGETPALDNPPTWPPATIEHTNARDR